MASKLIGSDDMLTYFSQQIATESECNAGLLSGKFVITGEPPGCFGKTGGKK